MRWVAEGSNVSGLMVYCAAMIVIVGAWSGPTTPTIGGTSDGKTVPSDSRYDELQLPDYGRVLMRDYGRVRTGKKPSPPPSFVDRPRRREAGGAWPISYDVLPEPTPNWKAHPSFIVQNSSIAADRTAVSGVGGSDMRELCSLFPINRDEPIVD